MVHYQYSGNKHDVIAGIGLVNLLWHDLTSVESIPIDYRIYDKDSDGKTKNTHFSEMLALARVSHKTNLGTLIKHGCAQQ
ncbi:hypothetical protein CBG25_13835 [Arsenophonus sp. ENCA]|nr:hypothetical protein CBG25_13835 [Arsenophonus sp. ENCA]